MLVTRPRKSIEYPMSIQELLLVAKPTRDEIKKATPQRRREIERERVLATEKLARLGREIEKRGHANLDELEVVNFLADVRARNGGELPKPRGGRPDKEHEQLKIALYVDDKVKENGTKSGAIGAALCAAAEKFCLSFERIEEIYYGRGKPSLEKDLALSRAL